MGNLPGSIIPPGAPKEHYGTVPVLTDQGIMERYNMTRDRLERIKKGQRQKRLLDILRDDRTGPRYHVTLSLVAHSR
jgi:hypothetical protein